MIFGAITFAARNWFWPVALLFLTGFILILWQAIRSQAPTKIKLFSVLLRTASLALLALCLLEPMRTENRAKPGANFFAVIADNSMGMQIHDANSTLSRGEQLRERLLPEKQIWLTKLGQNFQVRKYNFDSRLQTSKDFTDLNFEGRSSAIGAALRMLNERFQGQPLAGALLLTDGNATDLPDGISSIPAGVPIYPVVVGRAENLKDVSITQVSATQTAFEDAPVSIVAQVSATGISGKIVAQLVSDSPFVAKTNSAQPVAERVVAEQTEEATGKTNALVFRFQTRPEKPGLNFYKLKVAAAKPLSTNAAEQVETEATLYNNTRSVVVDRGRGPYRILYVSGRPNWEYKFLHRALAEDEQVQLVGLMRVARREKKFTFRGRTGESSNPLFRGFDKVDEETQRYDQPVLIRLNTKDDTELRSGYPKTAEDLFAYHAIIVDDLESEFFTTDQMLLTQKFVSERGGGFMMLGGVDSFSAGKYERTPIADMLPIYIGIETHVAASNLHLDFTLEGLLQPWARLRASESDERNRLATLPGLNILNSARGIKPGASVVLTATEKNGRTHPALVVQRFGSGRTAALPVGDMWRSGLQDENMQKDLGKFWRQLARWLTADVPEKIELAVAPKPADPDGSVFITVKARNKKFQPLENATVKLLVTAPSDNSPNLVSLNAEASNEENGIYRATYIPRLPGAYKVAASVVDESGITIGEAETGWSSDPLAEEFKNLAPNRSLLEAIANKTGGTVVEINALEKFVESLPNRKAPMVETHSFPLWHQPLVFLAALALLIAEWGMRRFKGLA